MFETKRLIIRRFVPEDANDVYVIQTVDEKEVLIPAIKSVVKDVDIEDNKMIIELMEGLVWLSLQL